MHECLHSQLGHQVCTDATCSLPRQNHDGFVALNFADRPADVRLPELALPGPSATTSWRVGLSTHDRPAGAALAGTVTLQPYEALIAVEG